VLDELEGDPKLVCLGGKPYLVTTGFFLVGYWKFYGPIRMRTRVSHTNRHPSPWGKCNEERTNEKVLQIIVVGMKRSKSKLVNMNLSSSTCPLMFLGNRHDVDLGTM